MLPAGLYRPTNGYDASFPGKNGKCLLLLPQPEGNPCSKCQASKKQCVFSSSDRLVSVPESYLRQLENQTQGATSRPRQQEYRPERHTAVAGYDEGPVQRGTPVDRLISDSTTEHFISKLTKVYSHSSQGAGFATDAGVRGDEDGAVPPKHTYISLEYDNAQQTISIKLPPHSYASYLFGQFETFIGSDYYWFRKRIFRAKLDSIYHATRLQSEDRIWLACFSVVMALGESYSDNSAPAFTLGIADGVRADTLESASPAQMVPPGFEFFKQALLLVQFPYEEPTLEQIEAINLIPDRQPTRDKW
ncbi:hypothetical protein K4F52_005596 [Lecanicillium sp. MT-2017a]|nr:hypothetical protein K4F52_005596 [Lecanicillium sp. MT-2017a]